MDLSDIYNYKKVFSRIVVCLAAKSSALQHLQLRIPGEKEVAISLGEGAGLLLLKLVQLAVPWRSKRLVGLRSLSLTVLERHSPSFQQLMFILDSSSAPEHLRLSRMNRSWADDTPNMYTAVASPIINLPCLDTLELREVSNRLHSALITRLYIPNCQSLSLLHLLVARPRHRCRPKPSTSTATPSGPASFSTSPAGYVMRGA